MIQYDNNVKFDDNYSLLSYDFNAGTDQFKNLELYTYDKYNEFYIPVTGETYIVIYGLNESQIISGYEHFSGSLYSCDHIDEEDGDNRSIYSIKTFKVDSAYGIKRSFGTGRDICLTRPGSYLVIWTPEKPEFIDE